MLQITEIQKNNELFQLRDEWNKVLEKCPDNNVFLTWEFLWTYWNHLGGERKLRTMVIRDKNEIIGIAPFRQSRYSFEKALGYNVIEPLGYGADYTGLILTKRRAECIQVIMNYLDGRNDWDFIYLYDLPATSTIAEQLQFIVRSKSKFKLKQGTICPYLPLPSSKDLLMQELSKKFRKNLRNYRRLLEKDCRRIEFKKAGAFDSVEKAMEIFFNLHQERWESKNRPGAFATERIRNFYVDVASQFAKNGWLELYFLTVDDEPVAATYNYVFGKKLYYVLGGFNPAYSRFSVGHLLHQKAIEDCIIHGISEYDFLKGDEPYKFLWTNRYRRNFGVRFVNSNFRASFLNSGINLIKQTGLDWIFENHLDM
jgi:CelD/BcsL family acetyltransferase involved in cellulose biosynthesis